MLLVTFHGGNASTKAINNVYGYEVDPPGTTYANVLQPSSTYPLSELRGLVWANSLLYVVNGAKHVSNVQCFKPGTALGQFNFQSLFCKPSTNKKGHFESAIAHPYALALDGAGSCYISNQDTNVVAKGGVASNFQSASFAPGCQSNYLNKLTYICPSTGCVYLDGTFVASQVGMLPDVKVAATNVPAQYGGLSVAFADPTKPVNVQNSVRDLAIVGGVLLACDEPSRFLRLYSLSDGTYLGSGPTLPASPTHLAMWNGGLYVSAGGNLYWSALPSPLIPSGLRFQCVLTAPQPVPPNKPTPSYKIGGIAFESPRNEVYVAFQQGTGTTGSGAIYGYSLQQTEPSMAPYLSDGYVVASGLTDTPEFLLFISDAV